MSLLNLMGITTAYAANAAPHEQNFTSIILMFVFLIGFMYFLIIRPQTKKAKEHRDLVSSLKKGDEVLTTGGLLGKIVKISDTFVVLNIAENVDITLQKPAIAATMPKGTIKSI